MKDKKFNHQESDDYCFMNETIKRKPLDKRKWMKRACAAAITGVIFGASATITLSIFLPSSLNLQKNSADSMNVLEGQEAEITLEPAPEADESSGSGESSSCGEDAVQKGDISAFSSVESYEALFEDILRISQDARKALVKVYGISGDADLLDDSIMSYGDADGIIFLQSDTYLYILTTSSENLVNAARLRVAFSNGAYGTASFCARDEGTGLAVLRVPIARLSIDTRKEIAVASFREAYMPLQAQTVIAAGSPAGAPNSLLCGMIASVEDRVSVTDAEYTLLVTDMTGSEDGGGVLLDTEGKVIALISHIQGKNTEFIQALPIAQLWELIENLCNDRPACYLGIRGTAVSASRAEALGVPGGVYVSSVDSDSPAMRAGIQSGDILQTLGGTEIGTMRAYSEKLQSLKAGQACRITLCRRDVNGEYTEMEFDVKIEEK